jgi:anti-sigma regulatory factor (Ser/Thr protein kinase)
MDRWIEFVGERWGVDHRTLFRARARVSELANNILEHGCVTQDRDSMMLALRHTPPGIEIQLSDTGAAFDPVAAPIIEPKHDDVGRRGLRIVRSYARALSYRRGSQLQCRDHARRARDRLTRHPIDGQLGGATLASAVDVIGWGAFAAPAHVRSWHIGCMPECPPSRRVLKGKRTTLGR